MAGTKSDATSDMTQRAAFESGRAARAAGKGEESMPKGYQLAKSLAAKWREGWESAAPAPVAPTEVPETATKDPASIVKRWPADKPMPPHYKRPEARPCPKCRAVLLADLTVAVLCESSKGDVGRFRCRDCGEKFQYPLVQR